LSFIERALQRIKDDAPIKDTRRPPDDGGLSQAMSKAVDAALSVMDRESLDHARSITLDLDAMRKAGLLPPADVQQVVARQFRRIKLPLIEAATGKAEVPIQNGNLIMVASALPGEGKTFTSVNLAFSLARERDLDVVLVDADVAKPHITDVLGLREEPGLMDALADEARDVASLILQTDVPRLSILPAGSGSEESATELLASARMQALVRRMFRLKPNRIVLFDSPPVLVTNESEVLSRLVGQIVLVVRAGVTPQAAVLDAIGMLGDKPIGVVLNQVPREPSAGHYGYGYGYGYGGYGSEQPTPGASQATPSGQAGTSRPER
jgi:exopolysaccharide/PEP-CTERM locus tyrosine autokinase